MQDTRCLHFLPEIAFFGWLNIPVPPRQFCFLTVALEATRAPSSPPLCFRSDAQNRWHEYFILSLPFPVERKTFSPNFYPDRLVKIILALLPPCSQALFPCRFRQVSSFWFINYKWVKRAALTLTEESFQVLHGRKTHASHSLGQVSLTPSFFIHK